MFEWIFGKIASTAREPKHTIKLTDNSWLDFHWRRPAPPILWPGTAVSSVKESKHKMLLACLTGGMSYEDAKSATDAEFADALNEAEKRDKNTAEMNSYLSKDYEKRCQEYENEVKAWYEGKGKGEVK